MEGVEKAMTPGKARFIIASVAALLCCAPAFAGPFDEMSLERWGKLREVERYQLNIAEKYYKDKVAQLYANGKAVSIASVLEIDEVIDPAETRHWIMAGLRSMPPASPRTGRKRPCIDAW